MSKVDQWIDRGLAWCVPRRCALCHQPSGGNCVCPGCRDDLPWLGPACLYCGLPLPAGAPAGTCGACLGTGEGDGHARPYLLAPLAYEYPVDRMVAGAKFHRRLHFARALGELLADSLVTALSASPAVVRRPDLLLPMPLHRRRLAGRGYNQAHELARPVSRALAVPVAPELCERVRHTPEQSGLSAAERRRNLRQAFAVAGHCAGASIAVVDDVITTGSTAAAVSRALYDAGATQVQVWAAARTL